VGDDHVADRDQEVPAAQGVVPVVIAAVVECLVEQLMDPTQQAGRGV
jgi:hypothetical protein